MARTLFLVLGFVTLVAAVPARGQGLLDAFVEGFVDGMNDGGNDFDNGGFDGGDDGYHHHHHHNHNGYYNPYPSDTYQPAYHRPRVVAPAVVQNSLPYRGPGVTIVLEQEEGGSVTYVIDDRESATIQAGQEQKLANKGKYEVRFSRGRSDDGRDFGQAHYTITEGNYHFKATEKGWELFRDKEQPNLVTAQPASPSGIRTNTLPSRPQPMKTAPAGATPAAGTRPAANAIPTLRADSFSPAFPAGTPPTPGRD